MRWVAAKCEESAETLLALGQSATHKSGTPLAQSNDMKANIATRCIGIALVLSGFTACVGSRSEEMRASPGAQALATGEPAGGESAPIEGRVDLPPQQPRR